VRLVSAARENENVDRTERGYSLAACAGNISRDNALSGRRAIAKPSRFVELRLRL